MKQIFYKMVLAITLLIVFSKVIVASEQQIRHKDTLLQKQIVFGNDNSYPPFTFLDDNGIPSGYYVDLIKEIGDVLNYRVEIKLTEWDEIVKGVLVDKTIDVTALAYQKRREKIFLFSVPHLIETSEIYVRKKTHGIESLNDLHDREVILMRNATTHMNLEDRDFNARYILVDSGPEALLLLSKGKHDAAIVGRHMGYSIIQRYNLDNLKTVGGLLFPRNYVFATAFERQELMDDINRGLNILKLNGHYNELNIKWFGAPQEQKRFFKRIIYYGILVIIPIFFLTCLSIVWNWSLKRKVNKKTSELQFELAERKRTEVALLESEAEFKKLSKEFKGILDSISGIIALFDKEIRPVWCNKTKITKEGNSISPPQIEDTISTLNLKDHQSSIRQCFENGKEIEFIDKKADGKTWEIKGFPMKNSIGQTTHLLILASDITETMQLREEAAAASRLASLGELSAGVAHEINNPTGLILLYIPLIKDFFYDIFHLIDKGCKNSVYETIGGFSYARAKTEIDKSLNGIFESANRIKCIVGDLKNFARQDKINMGETVDINASVKTAVRLTNSLIKNTTDNFHVEYDENYPKITGNIQQIEQVVINLIQNSCFALTNKKQRIIVHTKLDKSEDKIIIKIEDEGCGMDQNTSKRITDPFFTTRRDSGGTGIGLSISARIIEEHGAILNFESKVDKGTSARIVFPYRRNFH